MGSDFRDVNNDGLADIWYTAVEHQMFPLLVNAGGGVFDDATHTRGLQSTNEMSGWGNGIFDFDNDGNLDLMFVNGHINQVIETTRTDVKYKQLPLLLRATAGGFENIGERAGPTFKSAHLGRGPIDVVESDICLRNNRL